MDIWHRITYRKLDAVDHILDELCIRYKKSPLPKESYILTFRIAESDPRWPQVANLLRAKKALDLYDTIFTPEEILSAEWVRLIVMFEQGYPQPEATWVRNPINYEGQCPQCGAGYRQVAPFRLAKEPRLGRHDFFSLYWTYAVFCTPRVLETLRAHAIRGYEVWEALLHKTGQPSRWFPSWSSPMWRGRACWMRISCSQRIAINVVSQSMRITSEGICTSSERRCRPR
jgi:hypothetical protein